MFCGIHRDNVLESLTSWLVTLCRSPSEKCNPAAQAVSTQALHCRHSCKKIFSSPHTCTAHFTAAKVSTRPFLLLGSQWSTPGMTPRAAGPSTGHSPTLQYHLPLTLPRYGAACALNGEKMIRAYPEYMHAVN